MKELSPERRAALAVEARFAKRRARPTYERHARGLYIPPLGPSDRGHVYVVGFAGYVKIGWSRGARRRLTRIAEMAPEELVVYALIAGTPETERELHRRFAHLRLRGEWFSHRGELVGWIAGGCRLDPARGVAKGVS